jgi:hypothetical protein
MVLLPNKLYDIRVLPAIDGEVMGDAAHVHEGRPSIASKNVKIANHPKSSTTSQWYYYQKSSTTTDCYRSSMERSWETRLMFP